MGIVKRIRDITLATLNDRLEKAEDPVKMIDQFLWSTREEIIQAERLHQQYMNHNHQLKQQWLQAEQQIERRESQAMIALKAGEESLARIALTEKANYTEKASSYRDLYEQSRQSVEQLEEQIRELRSEYQLVFDKREYYVARMESVRLQQRMNQRFGLGGMQGSGNMFQKMENRISDMEHEAQSLREIRGSNTYYSAESMSKNIEVERELEELKKKLGKDG